MSDICSIVALVIAVFTGLYALTLHDEISMLGSANEDLKRRVDILAKGYDQLIKYVNQMPSIKSMKHLRNLNGAPEQPDEDITDEIMALAASDIDPDNIRVFHDNFRL